MPDCHQPAGCRPATPSAAGRSIFPTGNPDRKPAGCHDRPPWAWPLDLADRPPQLPGTAAGRSTWPPTPIIGISWAHRRT